MAAAREVGQRFIDAFNAHDRQRIRDLNGEDTVFEAPGEVKIEGRDAATEYAMAWVRAFPDARVTAHNEVVGDDRVVQEFTFTGTHEETLMSPAGEISPTHPQDAQRPRPADLPRRGGDDRSHPALLRSG
jgi:predicted ester cyclase